MERLPKPKLRPRERYSDEDIKILLEMGHSQHKIAKDYHISPKRISRISNDGECKPRGAPKKFFDIHERFILELVYICPRISTRKIIQRFKQKFGEPISKTTILRLLDDSGYEYRSPIRVPLLTPSQIFMRYNFAHNFLEKHPSEHDEIWKRIIFSDESKFNATPDCIRLWRTDDDTRAAVCIETQSFPLSAMVWGAIGFNFKSGISFFHGSVTGPAYTQMLKETRFFEKASSAFAGRQIFQQDRATVHMAESTLECITPQTQMLLGWPLNSPDMSPIEICWPIMKLRISFYDEFPASRDALERAIEHEWMNLDQQTINSLVLSFHQRLKMVIRVHGKTISPYLSKGMCICRIPDPIDDPPPLFNSDDDSQMMRLFQEYGRKWKAISRYMMSKYPPSVIKYRILLLEALKAQAKKQSQQIEVSSHADEPSDDETNGEDTEYVIRYVGKGRTEMVTRKLMSENHDTYQNQTCASKNKSRAPITFKSRLSHFKMKGPLDSNDSIDSSE